MPERTTANLFWLPATGYWLLIGQRDQRIGLGGASRRQHTRDQRDGDQHRRHRRDNGRIHRTGLVELRLQRLSQHERADEAQRRAKADDQSALTQHQAENAARCRPQRPPNANLATAL